MLEGDTEENHLNIDINEYLLTPKKNFWKNNVKTSIFLICLNIILISAVTIIIFFLK